MGLRVASFPLLSRLGCALAALARRRAEAVACSAMLVEAPVLHYLPALLVQVGLLPLYLILV